MSIEAALVKYGRKVKAKRRKVKDEKRKVKGKK
jgi:hypothetical protein